ncbi:MAG: selenide, water dikinase SelD [Marinifilaceae bacterium]
MKLTEFSPGAGCGCKIAPKDLEEILRCCSATIHDPNLLVGNESKDDAAVYDLGDGTALVSTTDFFTPIVDDAYDFGRIAATNALSDIYAMGGTPLMAIAILAWPLEKLGAEAAGQVVSGARDVCNNAGIVIAGGHSINIDTPVFGLAVTGRVDVENVKRNNSAIAGCTLFLTKPLGIGVMTTAEKKKILEHENNKEVVELMCHLNKAGYEFGKQGYVRAMTDVTGFGLLGHLSEICEGSDVNAVIWYDEVPKIEDVEKYIAMGSTPGGTKRNWNSYEDKIGRITEAQRALLCDPQTSGGLLVAVEHGHEAEFLSLAASFGYTDLKPIGELVERNGDAYINVD